MTLRIKHLLTYNTIMYKENDRMSVWHFLVVLAVGRAHQNPGQENHVVAWSLWWSWPHSVSGMSAGHLAVDFFVSVPGGAMAVVDPT